MPVTKKEIQPKNNVSNSQTESDKRKPVENSSDYGISRATHESVVSFDPNSLLLKKGETKTVAMQIDTGKNSVNKVNLAVKFDPAIISISSVKPTSLFNNYYRLKAERDMVYVDAEVVVIDFGDGSPVMSPFTGKGTIALLSIEGKNSGKTDLKFTSTNVFQKNDNVIRSYQNGSVIVQ